MTCARDSWQPTSQPAVEVSQRRGAAVLTALQRTLFVAGTHVPASCVLLCFTCASVNLWRESGYGAASRDNSRA